jgi:hypothetical protein
MLLATTSLNCKQRDYCPVAGLAFVIACLLGAAAPAFAQESAKGSTEKWRPKDGLYAEPGADFNERCMNSTEFSIELSEKSISGKEWSCAINKMVNTASGAIQLNMTCNDLNLAAHIKASDDKEFKEVMLLKRINEQSISVRKTLNGKFEGPNWQADYCPEDIQRMHIEEKIKPEEEAKYKVPEQLLNPKQWRPRDGIYASPAQTSTIAAQNRAMSSSA